MIPSAAVGQAVSVIATTLTISSTGKNGLPGQKERNNYQPQDSNQVDTHMPDHLTKLNLRNNTPETSMASGVFNAHKLKGIVKRARNPI